MPMMVLSLLQSSHGTTLGPFPCMLLNLSIDLTFDVPLHHWHFMLQFFFFIRNGTRATQHCNINTCAWNNRVVQSRWSQPWMIWSSLVEWGWRYGSWLLRCQGARYSYRFTCDGYGSSNCCWATNRWRCQLLQSMSNFQQLFAQYFGWFGVVILHTRRTSDSRYSGFLISFLVVWVRAFKTGNWAIQSVL